jgi:NAD(P)H-hydrate epimerase
MKLHQELIDQIVLASIKSRKGENGRVLVIGGSKLFHVAPFWAAAAASRIVDMVHFSSLYLLNNELLERRAKENFWSGIVVPWEEIDHYIEEDDAILIGPGMERGEQTRTIVNELLRKYPTKRWVVDGGALQEVDPTLLTNSMIITPNLKEWEILTSKGYRGEAGVVLKKGEVDEVTSRGETYYVSGGVSGMTKGGTGDILSGIVVGLYAKSSALSAAYASSVVNKRVGERLASTMGQFFETSEMLPLVGQELAKIVK